MSDSPRPLLSVLCVTPDRMETLAPLFRALRAQTIADRLEIVLVGPAAAMEEDLPVPADCFQSVVKESVAAGLTNPQMRSIAIRKAGAPYVAFTEDHCFPEPAWAEMLVRALDEGADGVGPLMVSANQQNAIARINFLLEYGEWSHPESGGKVRHLPGHNSAYRTDLLLALGDRLEEVMELESPWLWEQSDAGKIFRCLPEARSHHFNFALLLPTLPLRFHGGRVFGACRSHGWPPLKRLLWAGALPLIIAVRWRRTLSQVRRFMPGQGFAFHALLPLLLSADSLGEVAGYLLGSGKAIAIISDLEFHRGRFTGGIEVSPPFQLS